MSRTYAVNEAWVARHRRLKAAVGLGIAEDEITGNTRERLEEMLLDSDPEFLPPDTPGLDGHYMTQEWYEWIEEVLS